MADQQVVVADKKEQPQTFEAMLASNPALLQKVVIEGDLSRLSQENKNLVYFNLCRSLGLNPLTRPFEYLTLNGKMILYAKRDCTDQLRKNYGVSLEAIDRSQVGGSYRVTVRATLPNGRTEEDVGASWVEGMEGENHSNAIMRAETKAKRRVTLSICGLGLMCEEEVDSVRGAVKVEDQTSLITEEEVAELLAEIEKKKANLETIKSHFLISDLSQLTVDNATKLKLLLSTKP